MSQSAQPTLLESVGQEMLDAQTHPTGTEGDFPFLPALRRHSSVCQHSAVGLPSVLFFRWYDITACHKGPSLCLTDGLTVVARFNARVSLDSVGQGGIWA